MNSKYGKTNLSNEYLPLKRLILMTMVMLALPTLLLCQTNGKNAGKSGGEQAVRQMINDLTATLGKNDAAALDRIYDDDYALTNESGVVTGKAERLAQIRSGEFKFESVSFDEVKIQMYGNTAVARYRGTTKAKFKGEDISSSLRVTLTFVKIKGRWQLVAAQTTTVK